MTLPVPLTEDEKVRIRHHLGFMAVTQASTFSLGTPASLETQFIIEGAFKNIPGESLWLIRSLIARCDAVEEQIGEDTENLAVLKIGTIQLNDHELDDLMKRYNYWRQGLANALGVVGNPFDKRPNVDAGGGSLNIPVRG